jgi:hypothetical protein
MKRIAVAVAVAVAVATVAALSLPALAAISTPQDMVKHFEALSGKPADAAAGKAFFLGTHTGGRADTPSCTTCHTKDVRNPGQLRTGKVIKPMASSMDPARFTDLAKVEKWLGRNCKNVLGRDCTAAEKANVIAWLSSQ